jgi:predicted RNA-binding Zn-ribbon protein involved in translation (DUF1610 family)
LVVSVSRVDGDPTDPVRGVTTSGEPDQDETYRHCGACGEDIDATSDTCPNCGSDLVEVSYATTEVSEEMQKYANLITNGYADIAKSITGFDVSRYLPNDEGVELIEKSSFTVTQEIETHDGIAWTGILKIGDVTLHVEQDGRGGSSRYYMPDGRNSRLEELNARVAAGFPGLAGGVEGLDDLCGILEAIQGAKNDQSPA